jgi:uncharacterized membrane protein YoaK (UPF0700 family)
VSVAHLQGVSTTRRLALLLAATAGFVDAYVLIERGGVLATVQLGNVALLAGSAATADWTQAARLLACLVTFAAGTLAVVAMTARRRPRYAPTLEALATGLAVLVLLAAAYVPASVPELVVALPLVLLSALQVQLLLCSGLLDPGPHTDRFGLQVAAAFAAGAAAGAVLSPLMGHRAAAVAALVMLFALAVVVHEPDPRVRAAVVP